MSNFPQDKNMIGDNDSSYSSLRSSLSSSRNSLQALRSNVTPPLSLFERLAAIISFRSRGNDSSQSMHTGSPLQEEINKRIDEEYNLERERIENERKEKNRKQKEQIFQFQKTLIDIDPDKIFDFYNDWTPELIAYALEKKPELILYCGLYDQNNKKINEYKNMSECKNRVCDYRCDTSCMRSGKNNHCIYFISSCSEDTIINAIKKNNIVIKYYPTHTRKFLMQIIDIDPQIVQLHLNNLRIYSYHDQIYILKRIGYNFIYNLKFVANETMYWYQINNIPIDYTKFPNNLSIESYYQFLKNKARDIEFQNYDN